MLGDTEKCLRQPLVLLAALLLLPGCNIVSGAAFHSDDDPLPPYQLTTLVETGDHTHAAVVESRRVQVDVKANPSPPREYRVGSNDVLQVRVYNQPELGSPISAGAGGIVGSRVDGAGRIQLPMIGAVQVDGLTVRQIQDKLQQAYGRFIEKPWVVVEIAEYRSQAVYLVGDFRQPGVIYMRKPTNVVQALAEGGGVAPTANLRAARVMRNNRVLPIDIHRLLKEGDFSQNIWLQPSDAIYVPDSVDQRVFIVSGSEEPGVAEMIDGKLTLSQALAQVRGPRRTGVLWSQVRVIRTISPTRGELIVVDFNKILNGSALPFPLEPGDIIYLPRTPLGRWNDILREVSPSLQFLGTVSLPFIQLQELND